MVSSSLARGWIDDHNLFLASFDPVLGLEEFGLGRATRLRMLQDAVVGVPPPPVKSLLAMLLLHRTEVLSFEGFGN